MLLLIGAGFLLLGLHDDRNHVHPGLRLFVSAALFGSVILLDPSLALIELDFGGPLVIPLGIVAFPFTILCLVGLQNAINMADGMNGLLIGLSLFWTACLLKHAPDLTDALSDFDAARPGDPAAVQSGRRAVPRRCRQLCHWRHHRNPDDLRAPERGREPADAHRGALAARAGRRLSAGHRDARAPTPLAARARQEPSAPSAGPALALARMPGDLLGSGGHSRLGWRT